MGQIARSLTSKAVSGRPSTSRSDALILGLRYDTYEIDTTEVERKLSLGLARVKGGPVGTIPSLVR